MKHLPSHLQNTGYLIDEEDLKELLESWKSHNILKDYEEIDEQINELAYEKYDRQIKNFGTLPGLSQSDGVKFQKILSGTTVGLIGVGGVGSYIAHGLSLMGIGGLKLVEGDIIELSNTSRQILYHEHAVGRKKVEVAKEQLQISAPKTSVKTLDTFVNRDNLDEVSDFLSDVDFIVLAADTPRGEIEYITDEIAYKNNTPWLTFAPFNFSKVFIGPLIIPNKTKRLHELIPQTEFVADNVKVKEINERFFPTIMDPYNGIAAKMALIEIVKYITGYTQSSVIDKRILLDTATWEIEHYEL